MDIDQATFFAKFRFNPGLRGAIGIEREYFLTDEHGAVTPQAERFLQQATAEWTCELSACQVEHRTAPHLNRVELRADLARGQRTGAEIAARFLCRLTAGELAPENMPLDVYPTERYRQIAASISRDRLRAACRVAGLHIHNGVANLDEALRVHNAIARHIDHFATLGDHSQGERLRLYKTMAPNWEPPIYESAAHFYEVARAQNFLEDPRSCYHLVRISVHGTVEVRAFGMTYDIDEIDHWIDELDRVIQRG